MLAAMTTTAANAVTSPADTLRAAMNARTVGLPGAFNGLCARLAQDAGFEALYVSGAAVTASNATPDVGMLGLPEFTSVIHQVSRSTDLPVIADADTGFGEEEMVARIVHEYHRAGAAGFHIEDQLFPKRCGHLDGKTLIPADHFVEKVAAAAAARDTIPSSGEFGRGGFIVCARTDAFGVSGLDEAVARAKAYVDAAGADMIFPEGLRTEADFGAFADAIRSHTPPTTLAPGGGPYLLANMTEFGKTDSINIERFEELGYQAVIWPVSTLRIAMGAVKRFLAQLRADGDVDASLEHMLTRAELYETLRYTPGEPWAYPRNNG